MNALPFLIFIVCLTSVALADDFKTVGGKEYKNVKVSRVDSHSKTTARIFEVASITKLTEFPSNVR